MLLALAWKNIWRNKNRSAIVILAIAFGLWAGLFSGGLMVSMGESMVNSAIDRDLAHIQIHHPRYDDNRDIRLFIPNGAQIVSTLAKRTEIVGVAGRLRFTGMATSATTSFPVLITGVNPQDEVKVTKLKEKIVEGAYFQGKRKNMVLIGRRLANRLKVHLNSKIILGFEGLQGELVTTACKVVGIFESESSQFDESNIFLKNSFLQATLGSKNNFHEIAIRVRSSEMVAPLTAELKAQFPDLKVESWKERAPEVAVISDLMIQYTYLFLVFILFAVLFGITNTMLMSVVDRIHELGMLLAIGMARGKVFFMILLESLLLSMTGGIIGIVLGSATIAYTAKTGIDLSSFSASLQSFGTSSILRPALPGEMYLILTILIVLTANAAALMPAWKAIRLQPATAIRTY